MSNAPFPPGSRIAIYLRDSGGEEQELSTAQQKKELSAWAAQEGLVISQTFSDAAAPGSSTVGREQFHAMLHHFKNGAKESGVVVWKFSRFARNIDDAQFYRADLRRRGFIVHSQHDQIPSGADGRLFEAAIDWMNERYLADLSEDVKRGLRFNVTQHNAVPGNPPKGFMRVPLEIGTRRDGTPHIVNQWQPDPEVVPLIRLAFEMRANGQSYANIQKETRLYKSKNGYTTFFKNKIYKGILIYGEIIVDSFCDPIVTPEIWEKVQRIGRRRKNLSRIPENEHPRRVGSAYLLSGIVQCQICGSPLNAHTIKMRGENRREFYACSRRKRRGDCPARHIPRHALEEAVTESLLDQALSLENLLNIQSEMSKAYHTQRNEDTHHAKEREERLAKVEKEIANLTAAIAKSGHSRALLSALSTLELEQDDLKTALERLNSDHPPANYSPPELATLAEEVKRSLKSENPEERRIALRSLFTRVVIRREKKRLIGVLYYFPKDFVYLRAVPPGGLEPVAIQIPVNAIIKRKKRSPS